MAKLNGTANSGKEVRSLPLGVAVASALIAAFLTYALALAPRAEAYGVYWTHGGAVGHGNLGGRR